MKQEQELTLEEKIDLGIRRGVARALAEDKKAGRSVAIWRDGKVVMLPPEEIEIPEEFKNFLE